MAISNCGLVYLFLQVAKKGVALVASLQKGDQVVTGAGIHGRVHEAKADTLVLEIAPNTFLTVDRDTVRRKVADTQVNLEKP